MSDTENMKIKYVDEGNTIIISATREGLQKIEYSFGKLSKEKSDIKLNEADYLDPELISNLKFSSRHNSIEIISSSGEGWDFQIDPESWKEFRETTSALYHNRSRRALLHADNASIPSYQMFLELEE